MPFQHTKLDTKTETELRETAAFHYGGATAIIHRLWNDMDTGGLPSREFIRETLLRAVGHHRNGLEATQHASGQSALDKTRAATAVSDAYQAGMQAGLARMHAE